MPVHSRPDELDELLKGLTERTYTVNLEVVVIEDGSTISSESICQQYQSSPSIIYLAKPSTGPGGSRNYGVRHAKYDYLLILDSDCLSSPHYLEAVDDYLQAHYVDCFGGADTADKHFTKVQKAINYTMTSFFTAGGIRGSARGVQRFESRSSDMGFSRVAFEATGGFGKIHPGESPDSVTRLRGKSFEMAFIPEVFVFCKRRISWQKFQKQVSKFRQIRAILSHWHPHTRKITFWLPTCSVLGFYGAILLVLYGYIGVPLVYLCYFVLIAWGSARKNGSIQTGLMSVWAVLVQFSSYGFGFLRATLKTSLVKKSTEVLSPKLLFA